MQTRSFLLDIKSWDLTLDDSGNISITDNPYAVAQDVACACSTYLGECWYDTTLGLPYYQRILGHWPGIQLINSKMQQEAMKLPYVQSAICKAISGDERTIVGTMTITDTNNQSAVVNF
ncbi:MULTISPECIES: hypothetical protein [Photorhabdus]|uniref:hypothetical protein n=1 Tax=Photorhabdus TaxID=29487 RepID=UPI000DCB827F|nr:MULTISPECIES: hypothetical protein [Photorhabdus]MCT8341934.1 hypothetical protein [Photorhabdus kleinii]RAX02722.1 hypothetical protein CKY03_04015 [Photorhabdus sp. S9-53]RAX02960.1 hypothetical protein CKY05_04020 [Photorhabdus sp. S10-54]RAX05699.1 hypothetical protein CKY04_04015 [Photorhabdus sp. S8-52]